MVCILSYLSTLVSTDTFYVVSLPGNFHVWLSSKEASFLRRKFVWVNWDVEELQAKAKEIEASTRFNIGLETWPFETKI